MVGDSLKADIEGALAIGMRAVLLRRSGEIPPVAAAGRRLGDYASLLTRSCLIACHRSNPGA